jgi:alpha,alpha-trehalase
VSPGFRSPSSSTPSSPTAGATAFGTRTRAVREQLSRDFYVYRFRHDQRDLEAAEGAFLLCGFMMALAEHQQGDPVRAARYFDRNRTACGPPGPMSEEYDISQRQMCGNLPQAFVHALLLECAGRLASDQLTPD